MGFVPLHDPETGAAWRASHCFLSMTIRSWTGSSSVSSTLGAAMLGWPAGLRAGSPGCARGGIDVVALDYGLAGRPGPAAVLDAILALPDAPPLILLIGPSQTRIGVAGLRAGATRCVIKDLGTDCVDALDEAIRAARSDSRLRLEKSAADREMRDARDRFEALAAERQVLLHEVNHRVGNSLQLVGAFLHMQASSSASAETRQALGEANRRVLAVAQVHRRLYATDDVQSVALGLYLRTLIDDIRDSTDAQGIGELLTVAADEVQIDPDSAVTIGIIVTELVINAMKHAYPSGDGPIRVLLRAEPDPERFRLLVEDDGVGRARETGSPTGIGETIIPRHGLEAVLDGRLRRDGERHPGRHDVHGSERVRLTTDRSIPKPIRPGDRPRASPRARTSASASTTLQSPTTPGQANRPQAIPPAQPMRLDPV